MTIQWYPGHMYKASKEMQKVLPRIDLIIEVLDARIPFSSQNPMLSVLCGRKPRLRVLSKADLAEAAITRQWQDYFEQKEGVKTLAVTTKQPAKIKQISALCRQIIATKGSNDKPIITMIMGIPNVGKSTLVNILANRIIAKTGNEPAVTKRQQRIALDNNVVLFDTPGVLWANVKNKNSGYRLAATGAIKDTAMAYDDVAWFVADYLLEHYPQQLQQRYQLSDKPDDALDLILAIGAKRGCLRAGKRVDKERVAKILIAEFRAGMIANISLETPAMMEREQAALAFIKERKDAKKRSKKTKQRSTIAT